MRFGNPQMLWVLVGVPVLAALIFWSQSRRRQALARFAGPASLARMGISLPGWRAWVRPALSLLAVSGIILATARPQWGWEDRRIVSRGVDLMIAIDTSNSMLAQDYKPNRLARAKELLQNIIWEAKGDRIGVMAFAGNTVVLCPLTLDYSMANTALESVDEKTIATQGTAIGLAIDAAIKAFEAGGAGERVLVLLTDGEDQGTEPLEAAKRAAAAKIKIFCIGIGSTQGTLIPVQGGYKQDKEGHPVNSKLDFQTLSEIARHTNGRAMKSNFSGAAEVSSLLAELNHLKGANQQDRIYRVYKERYAWFLVPAIILLLLEAFGVGGPRRRQPANRGRIRSQFASGRSATILAFALLFLMSVPTHLYAYPGEAKVLSDRALREYKEGNYAKAAQVFAEAATKAGDNALTKFNLGAASYKAGDSTKAADAFKSVFDPENPAINAAAEYNTGVLEHKDSRREIEAKKPEWEKAAGQGDEKVMEDIKKTIAKLETASNRYKSAIMKVPNDQDMKVNYEIARRDLEEARKLLEKQQPPEQQQGQQQKQQPDKQDQKPPPPQQSNQEAQDQQGNKGEQQKKDEKQQQQNEQKQDQQKKQPENEQAKKDQQNKDQQQPEKPEQDQQQEGKDGKQPKPETAKATPTPQPGKNKDGNVPGGFAGDNTDNESGEPKEELVAIGEMSKSDVDRLLNSLPPENNKALQKFLNSNYKMRENMDKDW
ncbi:MAG: VWA domain-containing protein [Candidatus Sumerlaeaceae bacterium]